MSIWYPIFEFYLETHDRMLEEFGGFPGLELGAEMVFNASLEKVKQTEGDLFQKAGVMLERLRSDRIVKDAQKRTAYTVTATFLEMNGEKICVTDPEITNEDFD